MFNFSSKRYKTLNKAVAFRNFRTLIYWYSFILQRSQICLFWRKYWLFASSWELGTIMVWFNNNTANINNIYIGFGCFEGIFGRMLTFSLTVIKGIVLYIFVFGEITLVLEQIYASSRALYRRRGFILFSSVYIIICNRRIMLILLLQKLQGWLIAF